MILHTVLNVAASSVQKLTQTLTTIPDRLAYLECGPEKSIASAVSIASLATTISLHNPLRINPQTRCYEADAFFSSAVHAEPF